jgi:PPOX class probable F420-dependent enzyme
MSTNSAELWDLFGRDRRGVLVTTKRDGRPQLSNVGYRFDPATRRVTVSATDDRAKTRNLRRDPRASFYVTTPDLGAYAVGEGAVELSPVATRTDAPVVDQLVDHYRAIRGEHPDWSEFRTAMAREQRVLIHLTLTRVYGWNPA